MLKKKLVLGSANFSRGYGLKSGNGLRLKDLSQIYNILKKNNSKFLDTAFSYPGAEKKIALSKLKNLNIYNKISIDDLKNKSLNTTFNLVKKSLKNLKKKFFYAVYFHNSKDLLGPDGKNFYRQMTQLKKKNLTKKIGVSVYSPEELDKLLKKFNFDIVQIPINIFDRRFLKNNYLIKLKRKGIEIHARSIFLQGLLLLDYTHLPKYFKKWSKLFKEWDEWNIKNNQKKILTCLNFIYKIQHLDKVVLGVSSYKQFNEIISLKLTKNTKYPKKIFNLSKNLVDPRSWENRRK